ncbi:MAG: DUF3078 domain-containing protein [Ignavibacteria bacterium]|nr:DUF3078 domain-containing protein [Ignavibacteria bacterium]
MPLLTRILFCFIALVFAVAPSGTMMAQEDTTAVPVFGWTHSLIAGFGLTQASYTNWASGGENSLAFTATADGKSTQDMETTNWETSYKFAYGQSRVGTQGLRKTDDKIDISSVLMFKLWNEFNPYAAATFKSQFTTGYEYDAVGTRTAVSAWFDPAYMTQTAGIEYKPSALIKTRFGAGFRETITSKYPVYADDPETVEIETTLFQGILESVTDLEWVIEENIVFTSKLEMIAPFESMDRIIVRNDNVLAAKVGDYFTTKLNVELLNDWRVTRRTQVRETVSIGISYALL